MSRGILYIVWGDEIEGTLQRSIRSLNAIHPELPYEIVRLPPGDSKYKNLLEKPQMIEFSPFEETLYLDADTVVLDRLDFGFEQAKRFGVACCINECPWVRRYNHLPWNDAVEYNAGIIFFTRKAETLFDLWKKLSKEIDSSLRMIFESGQRSIMLYNDQASFAKAIADWGQLPFILPLNWNFRPEWHWTFFGPIKIWHDHRSIPPDLQKLTAYYRQPTSIIQFHDKSRPLIGET